MKKLMIFFIIVFLLGMLLEADDLEETLESLSGEAAKAYVAPIVSAFGTNLNGGWFHKAPKAKVLGLNFELGVVAMATPFDDEDKSFSKNGYFTLSRSMAEEIASDVDPLVYDEVVEALMEDDFIVEMSGPTIVGPEDESMMIIFPAQDIMVELPDGSFESVTLPETSIDTGVNGILEDLDFLPLAAPQLSIGTIYGTQLSLRYLPTYSDANLGDISYMGFGLQHNPKAWLPYMIPVDISLAFFSQNLSVGDVMETNALCYGLTVSKTFGMKMLSWTPYAGYMMESAKMDFSYNYVVDASIDDPMEIETSFELESENKSRLTIGSTFRAGFFNLNVDYNIGKYNSVTAGLAFTF